MSQSNSLLKRVRQVHLYLGVFISPALLFFAITGALQTFSLHETTRGSDYKPPAWIVRLGQLHKKQTLVVPVRKAPPAAATPSPGNKPPAQSALVPDAITAKPKNLLPMKIFFLLVSIGLVSSTFSGIYMAYRYGRSKVVITGLLVAGIAVPLLLLLF
jgi:hypothetical protein